jgi:D-alanyl-D-alanine endopeptidase (penicillin-binding protein 7)
MLTHLSILTALMLVLGVGLFFVLVGVVNESIYHQEVIVVQGGMLSSISADSIYIFDLESGTEIFARDKDTVRPIASVTKLLSSSLFYRHATATDTTTITWGDVNTDGRSGRLQAGQQYVNKELLFPALLESSNDAAVVMQRVAPVDLIGKMNQYTTEHGLPNTIFVDTSGLADGNVSTADELGKLSSALYEEFPHIFDITRLKTYINHVNSWMNNNPFTNDEGYKGGKHGYTYAANRTVVAFFDETLQSGQVRTIGYVLLGSDGLQTDMKHLRAYVQHSVNFQ